MLVDARACAKELIELFKAHANDDDMYYFTADKNEKEFNYIGADAFNLCEGHQYAIYDGDSIVGYFSYCCDNVENELFNFGVGLELFDFGLYSFDKNNPIIGLDVYKEMQRLRKEYGCCYVSFWMIKGNPVEKHYDRIIKHFHGRKEVHENLIDNSIKEVHYSFIMK